MNWSWKNWKFLLILSVILVIVIAFSGCGGPKIPGKYLPEKGPGTLTLYKDGSCYLEGTTAFGQVALSGTWKQEDNDIILTFTGAMGQKASFKLVVQEDGVLIDPNGYKWIREDKFKQVLSSEIQQAPPREIAEKFVVALLHGDKDVLVQLSTGELKEKIKDADPEKIKKAAKDLQKEMSDFKVPSEDINGNRAIVSYEVISYIGNTQTGTMELIKTSDGWKVSHFE